MRKECVHRNEEKLTKYYSPSNTDIWNRDLDMEQGTVVESPCCRNKLSEGRVWSDKIGQ